MSWFMNSLAVYYSVLLNYIKPNSGKYRENIIKNLDDIIQKMKELRNKKKLLTPDLEESLNKAIRCAENRKNADDVICSQILAFLGDLGRAK